MTLTNGETVPCRVCGEPAPRRGRYAGRCADHRGETMEETISRLEGAEPAEAEPDRYAWVAKVAAEHAAQKEAENVPPSERIVVDDVDRELLGDKAGRPTRDEVLAMVVDVVNATANLEAAQQALDRRLDELFDCLLAYRQDS